MSKKTILVVDDTSFMVAVITKVLINEHYDVLTANSGERALKLLKTQSPDLILLDTAMGGMSGYDVCEMIRSDHKYNFTPIIMLCGQTSENDKVKGLERGADDYIIKPFDNREFLARIRNCLNRVDRGRHMDPLTGVHGNNDIEREIAKKIDEGLSYAVLYIELKNFRAFNCAYGLDKGDELLMKTAGIICESVDEFDKGGLVGRVSGDHFVAIVDPEGAIGIARNMITRFDKSAIHLYNDIDQERGCIVVTDKSGGKTEHGMVYVTIGIVFGDERIQTPLALAKNAEAAQERARSFGYSAFSV